VPSTPGINHLDAVRALEKLGFHIARQGKHVVMTDGQRIITAPLSGPEIRMSVVPYLTPYLQSLTIPFRVSIL